MDKKQLIPIVIAIVAVIAVGLYFIVIPHAPTVPGGPAGSGANGTPAVNSDGTTQVTPTRTTPPANVVVPEQGAANVSSGVAVPQVVAPASLSGGSSYRSFNITADNNSFSPDTIVVKIGDTVNIEMTAVDKNYDFTQPDYGFKTQVAKGTTGRIQFGATAAGKFTFYCSSCGGPSAGPVGYLIVSP